MELALLSSLEYPLPSVEKKLHQKFASKGVNTTEVHWEEFDFKRGQKNALIRTTWNYFTRFAEFQNFLADCEKQNVKLINDVSVIKWNSDKRYLLELNSNGIPVAPFRYFERGAFDTARAHLIQVKDQPHVVKPAVSGGAWNTIRTTDTDIEKVLSLAEEILKLSGLIVQPFVEEVVSEGEWSFIAFNGELSHHILKTPRANEFRCQSQFGSSITVPDAPIKLLESVSSTLKKLPFQNLPYVRVDGVQRNHELFIMEIEAIEPWLYFDYAPEAAMDRFVDSIVNSLHRGR